MQFQVGLYLEINNRLNNCQEANLLARIRSLHGLSFIDVGLQLQPIQCLGFIVTDT
jgi:hypothetical protein